MAFELKRNQSIQRNVKRLIRQQLGKVKNTIREASASGSEAVHDMRKCFKRIRAVLRLARAGVGKSTYDQENTRMRDASRPLTAIRDAKVIADALDALVKDQASHDTYAAFANVLRGEEKQLQGNQLSQALDALSKEVVEARRRMAGLSIHRKWRGLRRGVKRVYAQGRFAWNSAIAHPTPENLHEWRKQAKYLWHQLEVLEPLSRARLKKLGDDFHQLTHLLGDDHDLFLLRQKAFAIFQADEIARREKLCRLIDHRQAKLEAEAFDLGRKLFAKAPEDFVAPLDMLWHKWRHSKQAAKASQTS